MHLEEESELVRCLEIRFVLLYKFTGRERSFRVRLLAQGKKIRRATFNPVAEF